MNTPHWVTCAVVAALLLGQADSTDTRELLESPALVGRVGGLVAATDEMEKARKLQASTCQGTPEPMLWRATTPENRTVYLVATYHVPTRQVPLYTQVQTVLGCADVAYFELACPRNDEDGIGNYSQHCYNYSIADPQDSIATRLPQQVAALKAAAMQLVAHAPAECSAVAANVQVAANELSSSTNRKTLRAFYHQALQVLSPSACQRKTGSVMYEETLRQTFGSQRPTFGLRDVSMQCAIYQGNTVEQDQALAGRMIQQLSNASWRNSMTSLQEQMKTIMQCGNLKQLEAMRGDLEELPWLGESKLGQRNPVLAKGIMRSLETQPGKVIVAVIGVTHFLDFPSVQSVPTLLKGNGLKVERLTAATGITCAQSTYAAPGAAQLDQCLVPPGRSQPDSCNNFLSKFKELRGPDKMYGRSKLPGTCPACVNSTEKCTCTFAWQNETDFKNLCESTVVDGVHGQVLWMDLTRNPGSERLGPTLAEKTVKSLFQPCFATSCEISLLQDIALRKWYKRDPSLSRGKVLLRPAYPTEESIMSGGVMNSWLAWGAGIAAIAVCIGALIMCFLKPKKKKKGRGMMLEDSGVDQPPQDQMDYNGHGVAGQAGYGYDVTPRMRAPPSPDRQELDMYRHGPPKDNRDFPAPQLGAEPLWRPPSMNRFEPPQDLFAPLQVYDNTLLNQAMQMQQALGDAGSQAVQQMQMQALQGMQMPPTTTGMQMPPTIQGMQGMQPAPMMPLSPGPSYVGFNQQPYEQLGQYRQSPPGPYGSVGGQQFYGGPQLQQGPAYAQMTQMGVTQGGWGMPGTVPAMPAGYR